jgi:hypothetical protein
MAAAVEVVKLIGMKTQGAIGCKVKGNDAHRGSAKEERGGRTGIPLGALCLQDAHPEPGPDLVDGDGGRHPASS